MIKQLTVGSLFAGIGGICLGFKEAGFKVKWAVEYDKDACRTYRENFKDTLLLEEDIQKINPNELPEVDIITSGFPCQAFSIAGYRKGFEDPRGNLFFETMRFIKALKPKAYLLENVKNLVTHDNGNTFKTIREYIHNNNYSCIPKILNSKDYGDIPQTRERIYVIGFRGENGYLGALDKKNKYTGSFDFPGPIKLTKKPEDILEEKKQGDKYYYNNKYMYAILAQAMKNHGTIYQWRRKYVRENKSGVCPTLTANMGTGGHNVPLVKDRYDIRKLTPRECARFQGFPESFKFPEIADSKLYKQIGNSVTVPVIKRIAVNLRKTLML